MYIRRKVFSILTDEMGEERLYSVNETVFEGYEEREFANVRHLKKAANTFLEKSAKGKLTTKDVMRMSKFKGINSLKALENPNYDKVFKGTYNKLNKLSKGELGELVSKPEFINQSREQGRQMAALAKNTRLNKGDVKSAVYKANQLKDML